MPVTDSALNGRSPVSASWKTMPKASGESVLSSHHLSTVYAPAAGYKDIASGLLAMTLPKPVDNAVLWFRKEVKESIPWSGDPVS